MARLKVLAAPPKLRTLSEVGQERHASALELFFDLVFVVAVASLAELLRGDPSAEGFAHYGALFVPVWWAWVGYAFYADRFETDDLVYRLAIFGAMLAIGGVALTTLEALSDASGSVGFAASYVLIRLILIALYGRAYRHEPRARSLCLRYIAGFSGGAALWCASVFVPAPVRYGLWSAGMLVELATPLLSAAAVRATPIHASHITERLSLLTIIVLGETVVLAATGLDHGLGLAEAAIAAVGFLIAAALWWSYFAFVDEAPLGSDYAAWQGYLYGHLPLVAGIPATGVGVLLATTAAHEALPAGARWALCGGPASVLLSMGLIYLATGTRLTAARCWSRLCAGLALSALAGFGSGLPPMAVEALLLAVLVAQIALGGIGAADRGSAVPAP